MPTFPVKFCSLSLLCALLFSACGRSTLTVNPDRSGKIELSMQLPPTTTFSEIFGNKDDGVSSLNLDEMGKAIYKQFALGSTGFDAWTPPNITEGRDFTTVTMTGYFPDANKIDIGSLITGPGKNSDSPQDTTLLSNSSTDGTRWILVASRPHVIPSIDPKLQPKAVDPEEEDEVRTQVQELKAMVAPLLPLLDRMVRSTPPTLGQRLEIIPAGEIEKAEGMKTDGQSAWAFDSLRDNFALVKRIYSDEQMLTLFAREARRQHVGLGAVDFKKSPVATQLFVQHFLKQTDPSAGDLQQLTVIPGPPRFDYAAESKAARIAAAKYNEQLRTTPGNTIEETPPDAAMMGITFPKDRTTRIEDVIPSSPAARAGLMSDDVVEKFDGKKVDIAAALTALIRASKPGDKVHLSIVRDGGAIEIEVILGRVGDIEPTFRAPPRK